MPFAWGSRQSAQNLHQRCFEDEKRRPAWGPCACGGRKRILRPEYSMIWPACSHVDVRATPRAISNVQIPMYRIWILTRRGRDNMRDSQNIIWAVKVKCLNKAALSWILRWILGGVRNSAIECVALPSALSPFFLPSVLRLVARYRIYHAPRRNDPPSLYTHKKSPRR